MGIPRHNFLRNIRKQKQSLIERFRSDCSKVEITEETKVIIAFDGVVLKYSIEKGEETIAKSSAKLASKEVLLALFEEVQTKFEKVEITMSSPKIFKK